MSPLSAAETLAFDDRSAKITAKTARGKQRRNNKEQQETANESNKPATS